MTAQICALGLRRIDLATEKGATINGVIFPAPSDLSAFDARENGYQRVEVPRDMVEMISWQKLPNDAKVWVYVPYAPSVVAKYGVDSQGLPLCSGGELSRLIHDFIRPAQRVNTLQMSSAIAGSFVNLFVSSLLQHAFCCP